MEKEELGRLANASVVATAAALSGDPKAVMSPQAADVLLAVPALVDEVYFLQQEIAHLRAALHRMDDLGQGMSRSWYLREIADGLAFPPGGDELGGP